MSDSTLQTIESEGKTRAVSRGEALQIRGRWYARVRIHGERGGRPAFACPWASTREPTLERARLMAEVVRTLRGTKDASHLDLLPKILERMAEASEPKRLAELVSTVERLAEGQLALSAAPAVGSTFEDVGEMWTSGKLASRFPHHLKVKRSADDDSQRLKRYVYPVIGAVRIGAFTLSHAEQAMTALPSKLAPATRRQIAQAVHRVLKLAVFPLQLRESNPIPAGWLPRVPKGTQKKQAVMYPSEHDQFVGSDAPLPMRLFAGFVAREGMRHDEAERLTWADVSRGIVKLDENKTSEPRSWALRPSVARALEHWRRLSPKSEATDLVFVTEDGAPLRLRADTYREHVKSAGVDRAELLGSSPTTKPTAIHALRALFVTEALARGESESWVTDRTGHKSSQMVFTYKRRARTFREADMVGLGDLDALLGWAVTDEQIPVSVASTRSDAEVSTPQKAPDHNTPIEQARFKIRSPYGVVGSTPTFGTNEILSGYLASGVRVRRNLRSDIRSTGCQSFWSMLTDQGGLSRRKLGGLDRAHGVLGDQAPSARNHKVS